MWHLRRQVIVSVDGGGDRSGKDVREDEDNYSIGKSDGGGVDSDDDDDD